MFSWKPLLTQWSTDVLQSDLARRIDPPPQKKNWLGFSRATKDEIAAVEQRLGLTLPPSYVSFLQTTNGFLRPTPFIGRLLPAGEVTWFKTENQPRIDAHSANDSDLDDADYFDYTRHSGQLRAAHLEHLVQITDDDDGLYLLNPQAVTPDGEWEALFFADWLPGFQRYPSFAHLMLEQFRSLAELKKIELSSDALPSLSTPDPKIPRTTAKRKRKKSEPPPPPPPIEQLIDQLTNPDDAQRDRSVKVFVKQLKGRPFAARRQDLVPKLTEIFNQSKDPQVRAACVAALTEMAEKFQPPPLFAALSDPDPGVVLQGMFALTYFRDKRAVEPLCRFAESRAPFWAQAVERLGDFADPRAIPTLVKIITSPEGISDQELNTAAVTLGRFRPDGFAPLAANVNNADPRVRFAVACGLDVSRHPDAAPLLDKLESDPDEKVRKRAQHRVGHMIS
ncbi:MAG TPA: HEAT repeat domain-containing protein [Tepidisphaeraceae bacterium]|jgi:hypothetical protein